MTQFQDNSAAAQVTATGTGRSDLGDSAIGRHRSLYVRLFIISLVCEFFVACLTFEFLLYAM